MRKMPRFHIAFLLAIGASNIVHALSPDYASLLKKSPDLGSNNGQLSRRDMFCQASCLATAATLAASSPAQAADSTTVPTVKLGKSNLEVSRTIQGQWQLAGGHGRIVESDALANMEAHYNAGITTLDTADIYGVSE